MKTTLHGTIRQKTSNPCPQSYQQLRVHVYATTLFKEKRIAILTVAEDSTFTTIIDQKEKKENLLLKLYWQQQEQEAIELAQSGPHCATAELHIAFDLDLKAHLPWFPYLEQKLLPQLDGHSPIELEQGHIAPLACLSCVEEQEVRAWQQAYLWEAEAKAEARKYRNVAKPLMGTDEYYYAVFHVMAWLIEQPLARVFYAFAPNGNSQPLHQILTLSKLQLFRHLEQAVKQKCIDLSHEEQLDFGEALSLLRDYLLLHTRYDDRYYDAKLIAAGHYNRITEHLLLNEVLEAEGLRTYLTQVGAKPLAAKIKDQQKQFRRHQKGKGKPKKEIKKRGNPSTTHPYDKQNMKTMLEWDAYLQHFPPLLEQMVGAFYGAAWDLQPWYKYEQRDWLAQIDALESSPTYPDAFQQKEDYAEAIARSLEQQFPSFKVLAHLEKQDFPEKARLYAALRDYHDFDIQRDAISRQFTIHPDGEKPGEVNQEVYKLLQLFQRCIKLVGGVHDFNSVAALMRTNLSSALAITRLGKFEVQQRLEAEGMPFEVIHSIYCRAKAINDTTTDVAVQYMRQESPNTLMPRVLRQEEQNAAKRGLPNLESLFGSLDTCTCQHCQSVYSPAAYLTDMLHWFKSHVVCPNGQRTAYQELNRRRPDIKYLHLNCKNAHTLMPYIDLVNEVLLANLEDAPNTALMKSLQTIGESEALLVTPEHLGHSNFASAKDTLKTAKCALSLPYDKEWVESRAYLEQLGMGHAELLQVFGDREQPYYEDIAWAKAYLGLSEGEYKLLIEDAPTGDFWKEYLNLEASTKNLGQLLKALDMDKATFQAIYETRYVNGRQPLLPLEKDFKGCSWGEFEITSNLDDVLLHKLLRFERLKKKTGLNVLQISQAIDNGGANDITDEAIIDIAGLLLLATQINLSFDDVLAWFRINPFRHDTYYHWSLYYDAFYRKPHFSQERLDFFDRDFIDNPTAHSININSFSTLQLSWLNEVYGFEMGDIERLNELRYGNNTTIRFRTHHLQLYHFHAALAKGLRLSIADLLAFFKKIGLERLGFPITTKPSQILSFIEKVQAFQKLNISIQTFVDLDSGTGKYNLDTEGQAIDSTFNAEAQAVWDQIKAAIAPIFTTYPALYNYEDDFIVAQDEINEVPDLRRTFFSVFGQLLGLDFYAFTALERKLEDDNWYIECLNDIKENHSWYQSRKNFTSTYRYFYRATSYQKGLGLTSEDVKRLASSIMTTLPYLPNNEVLNWLNEDFNSNNFHHLIWFKKMKGLHLKFDVSIFSFIRTAWNFSRLEELNLTAIDSLFTRTYNDFFASYKTQFNLSQFKEIYIRTQAIAANPKDFIEVLDLFFQMWATAEKWQLTVPVLWDWVWDSYDLSSKQLVPLAQNHGQLKNTLQSRYDSFEAWAKAITPLHNQFRNQLRDALVTYYICHKDFENSAAIYAHFLLDPEMDACMKTSRIKLAISSTQLLMHRALMGLEAEICPDEDDKKEWQWRKNYRVWEANRKVFLYPENWIDPTLRLDKTPFFETLEDALLQDEINDKNAEKALGAYLVKLHQVARLDIRAFCIDDEDTLHVFARTFSTPYVYFYRTRTPNKKWTAWQQLDLDIEGDHLIPVFINRRLYLYWPMFIEKEHRKIKRVIEGEEQNAPYFEIKLCSSRLECGKWTPKVVLDGTLLAGHYAGLGCYNNLRYKLGQDRVNEDTSNIFVLSNSVFQDYTQVSMKKSQFYFFPEVINGSLYIHTRRSYTESYNIWHHGYSGFGYEDGFKINPCTGQVEIVRPIIIEAESRFLARPFYTLTHFQQFKEGLDGPSDEPRGIYAKNKRWHIDGSIRILGRSNDNYQLTYPVQYRDSMWHLPFFLMDRKRVHFFERAWEKKCKKHWVITPNGNGEGYYLPWFYQEQSRKYDMQPHEHPLVCLMLEEFNRYGIEGLLASKNELLKKQQAKEGYFGSEYGYPTDYIKTPPPKEEFDFDYSAAYWQYNWELFFHAPSLIARQLKSNAQYAEAIRWLQFVFDPTNREGYAYPYWRIKPFRISVREESIQNLLQLLGATGLNAEQEKKRKAFQNQIAAWRDNPFQPHKIAELRIRPYMLWTVCEYIDVLIEWADSLFRQDTMESINEATNLYLMAGELLGHRPEKVSTPERSITTCFDDVVNSLDDFSNVLIGLENEIINIDHKVCCEEDPYASNKDFQLADLMFCIPDNPKLLELWNRVEDRLFKIRHCMNIEGQVRELALFQPPIDPALLVQATALGLDIGAILENLNAPEPHYRFSYLLQKANEFVNEVKALGGQLLAALEKKDAEALSLVRQRHEQNLLQASKNIKKMQVEEAKQNLAAMWHGQKLIEIRLAEYEGKEYMNKREKQALLLTGLADFMMIREKNNMLLSQILGLIPQLHAGTGAQAEFGGRTLSEIASMVGTAFGIQGSVLRNAASMASTFGSYDRRQEDWDFQVKTAKEELKQMEKQLLAAEIRLAIAEKDLENHELQIEQSREVYDFIKNKFTSVDLYAWMATEVAKLHRQAYELAYDMAKLAERAVKKEVGLGTSIIQFNHWDSQKKGLLAGEQLSLQLRQLDDAYMKQNQRKFELSTNISLKLLDAGALVHLIQHQYCQFELISDLFQMNFKGKSLKNIKIRSIAVSIPCVTGPHISTHVKLKKEGGKEMITSTGVNDAGIFEPNFNAPRYLPFEYLAIPASEDNDANTTWELMLNEDSAFDLTTISDVVLHIRYEAEDGGTETIPTAEVNTPATEKFHLMSWRHDFPLEWQGLLQAVRDRITPTQPTLGIEHIPYQKRTNIDLGDTTLSNQYYLYKNEHQMAIGLPNTLSISDNQLMADGQVVEDVWLLYQLEYTQ